MSKLLEAVKNKPREAIQAQDTLKALLSERKQAIDAHEQVAAPLWEARTKLEEAEVAAGDAEAEVLVDGDDNKAKAKALEAAQKSLAAARDTVKRLEGTERGLLRKLNNLRDHITREMDAFKTIERDFRNTLIDVFASDLEDAVTHLDPVWREGLALSEYAGILNLTDVELKHPKTGQNMLPRVNRVARIQHPEQRNRWLPTSTDADAIRDVLGELKQLKRSAERQAAREPRIMPERRGAVA